MTEESSSSGTDARLGDWSSLSGPPVHAPCKHPAMSAEIRNDPGKEVLLVASNGGHLLQLLQLADLWPQERRHWVTFQKSDAVSLLDGERTTWAHHPTNRNIPNLIRNLGLALRMVRRHRVQAIVTTGAGVTVPFVIVDACSESTSCTSNRWRGSRPRHSPDGWPTLSPTHSSSSGPDSSASSSVPSASEPSLILLSLGTHQQPFPRALDLVEPLAKRGEEIVIQHGSTPPRPEMPNTVWIEFMPYEEVVDVMAEADSVICHAGVGTIMTALTAGHTPAVIPRLAQYDEHVDDHQLDIATRFAERGLVFCVTTETDLAPLLTPRSESRVGRIGNGSADLRAAVAKAAAAEPRHIRLGLVRQRRASGRSEL